MSSTNQSPQGESERQCAARLSAETGLNIVRNTVIRLRKKGVDTSDPEAVRHALAMQERKPRPLGTPPKPKRANQPPRPADGNQAAPRIVSDKTIRERKAEVSVGEFLWQWRDFSEWLVDVAPGHLEAMDAEEMRDWLREELEKQTAHLLEVWP